MKKLLTIFLLFPFLAFSQVAYYDSLLAVKLISKVERDRLVYGYLVTSIDARAPLSHTHGTDDIISGRFPPARLGTGTADSTKYLGGDSKWRTLPGGSGLAITGTDTSHWNQAYNWGDHTLAGYLTSYSESDPIFNAHVSSGITGTNISNWDAAYGWGDHASAGYLTTSSAAATYAPISHNHNASAINAGTLSDTYIASASAWNGKLDTLNSGSVFLLADFTTSSTTATSTNLKFAIGANQTYTVNIWGHASKASTTSGLKLAIDAPSGSTITGTEFRGGASYTTALTNGEISGINTLGGTFATGAGVKVAFRMEFTITTGGTSGYVTLQGATVTSNTMTIYAGTSMTYNKSRGL